jgi:hypothetical protein
MSERSSGRENGRRGGDNYKFLIRGIDCQTKNQAKVPPKL